MALDHRASRLRKALEMQICKTDSKSGEVSKNLRNLEKSGLPPKLLAATLRLVRRRRFLENSTHLIASAAVKESVFTNDLSGQDLTVFVVTHAAYTMQLQPYVVAIVAAAAAAMSLYARPIKNSSGQ